MTIIVLVSNSGDDIPERFSKTRRDAHVRGEGERILVDLFEAEKKDPREAYETSESFPRTSAGAQEATRYLEDYGFSGVRVEVPRRGGRR